MIICFLCTYTHLSLGEEIWRNISRQSRAVLFSEKEVSRLVAQKAFWHDLQYPAKIFHFCTEKTFIRMLYKNMLSTNIPNI